MTRHGEEQEDGDKANGDTKLRWEMMFSGKIVTTQNVQTSLRAGRSLCSKVYRLTE